MQNQDTQETNKNKLFVGNLPFTVGEPELEEVFSQYGELASVKLITDRETGRSRGFAFVEYTEEAAAQAAIEALNETEMDGRQIRVNIAQPPRPRRDFRGGGGGGGGRRDFGGGRRDNRNRF